MTVYYNDVAKEFVQHYFHVLSQGASGLMPMYAENAQLQINSDSLKVGRQDICQELADLIKLGHLTLQSGSDNFVAQPYDIGKILVTAPAKSESDRYIFTFIIAMVGEGNRFGVTHQLIHAVAK
jgi:hypothetical protein